MSKFLSALPVKVKTDSETKAKTIIQTSTDLYHDVGRWNHDTDTINLDNCCTPSCFDSVTVSELTHKDETWWKAVWVSSVWLDQMGDKGHWQ